MALSGNTLPQVSPGGSVSGVLHIVTSDGAGPYRAMVDTTGTGDFTNAMAMDVVTQVPGKNGNIRKTQARAWGRALESLGIYKRATNINEDYVSRLHHLNTADAENVYSHSRLPCLLALHALVLLLVNQMYAWSSSSILLTQGYVILLSTSYC